MFHGLPQIYCGRDGSHGVCSKQIKREHWGHGVAEARGRRVACCSSKSCGAPQTGNVGVVVQLLGERETDPRARQKLHNARGVETERTKEAILARLSSLYSLKECMRVTLCLFDLYPVMEMFLKKRTIIMGLGMKWPKKSETA